MSAGRVRRVPRAVCSPARRPLSRRRDRHCMLTRAVYLRPVPAGRTARLVRCRCTYRRLPDLVHTNVPFGPSRLTSILSRLVYLVWSVSSSPSRLARPVRSIPSGSSRPALLVQSRPAWYPSNLHADHDQSAAPAVAPVATPCRSVRDPAGLRPPVTTR